MTMPLLPAAFVRRITAQLGEDAAAYFAAMDKPPVRGLRANPHKLSELPLPAYVPGFGDPVPWAAGSVYLAGDSPAGALPLHEAGAYYLQEPSAMLPATLLAVRPGETVLDLCAAPGGKSTQLAAAMAATGTLVCNEPVPSRAQILSRNLERMGVTHAVVVCADPAALADRWPLLFDAVMVDAPCSGEGMFRRHPETRLEWREDSPEHCAARQLRILQSALRMLKPGGRLVYATCTLSEAENEGVIAALLAAHAELETVGFSVPIGGGRSLAAPDGQIRLYPHTVSGEGHFTALLRKTMPGADDSAMSCPLLPPASALAAPGKALLDAYTDFCQSIPQGAMPLPNAALGDTLLAAPMLPPLDGIRVLRAGLSLGQVKGKVFAPDHALAMAAPMPPLPRVALNAAQAVCFQRGEALAYAGEQRGFLLATHLGLALGFAKANDGLLKNHYPKGLRRP